MSNQTLVHETANAPGTNVTFNLAGNVAGRRSFAMAFATGAPALYVMTDGVQSEWGLGAFTAGAPNQLSRTTVYKNSANTTARLNFTGAVDVYNAVPAEMDLFAGGDWGGIAGGTGNALTCIVPMPLVSQVPGLTVRLRASAANTGAVTLNVNGLGANPLKMANGTDVLPGMIGSGALVEAIAYSATEWRMAAPVPAQGGGWYMLPGGQIVQFGVVTTNASGNLTVTLPRAFNSSSYSLVITPQATTTVSATYQSPTTGGFFIQTWASNTGAAQPSVLCSYIAIGS